MDDEDDDEEPRIDSLESEAFMSSLDVSLVSVPVFVLLICSRRRWWLAMPPLRPASRASSLVHSCAVPFWCAALPPLLAMSRCLLRSIDANPRSSLATITSSHLGAPKKVKAATDVPRGADNLCAHSDLRKRFPSRCSRIRHQEEIFHHRLLNLRALSEIAEGKARG